MVGASGKMGSFFLLLHDGERDDDRSSPTACSAAAVPRGVVPGYLSPPGSPIYVAIPRESWTELRAGVPADRRGDLVFVVGEGNDGGKRILSSIDWEEEEDATFVFPRFGVPRICTKRKRADGSGAAGGARQTTTTTAAAAAASWFDRCTVATTASPEGSVAKKTAVLSGRHSEAIALLLKKHGVETETVDGIGELNDRLGESFTDNGDIGDGSSLPPRQRQDTRRVQLNLENIHLAVWGRKLDETNDKPKHISIVGGGILGSSMALFLAQRHPDATIVVLDDQKEYPTPPPSSSPSTTRKEGARSVGKTTPASWAWINANSKSPKSYQILNQLGIHAWKHEAQLSSLPLWMGSLVRFEEYPGFVCDGGYPVEGPLSDNRIRELEPFANWKLDHATESSKPGEQAAATATAAAADDDDGNDVGFTFHFPDEACVDPSEAVLALRRASEKLGVRFLTGRNVTGVVRDPQTGKISEILSESLEGDGSSSSSNNNNDDDNKSDSHREDDRISTDLVVSAAGIGSAAPCLGGIPLLHRPGTIAFAHPTMASQQQPPRLPPLSPPPSSSSSSSSGGSGRSPRLSKILVDPLRSSHLLQRKDGTLVAGGGALEVGGSSGTVKVSDPATRTDDEESDDGSLSSSSSSSSLWKGAAELSPSIAGSARLDHVSTAVRPMPTDGLPVVGFVEPGLYAIVTHSGITLGPILASLAAGEITEDIRCDLLAPYRPSRFTQ